MTRDPNLVQAVPHAALVLSAFDSDDLALGASCIAKRSGSSTTMTYRQLYTLERCGLVERVTRSLYRLRGQQRRRPREVAELLALLT